MKEIFAKVFEFGGSFLSFAADDLYEYVYTPIGWITLAVVLFSTLSYYVFFDRPRFHRWWHWLTILGLTAFITLAISVVYTISSFNNQGLEYGLGDYFEFLIAVVLLTSVLFFLFSLFMRSFSTNRRKTPF